MTSQALILKIHCTLSANQKEIVSSMYINASYLVLRYTEVPPVFVRGFVISKFFSTYFTTIEPSLTATSLP